MHSVIFQLSEHPIPNDEYISDTSLCIEDFPQISCINYIGDPLCKIEKAKEKLHFVSMLPKGMFEYNKKSDCITYVKYPQEHIDKWISKLKGMVSSLTHQDFVDGVELYNIRRFIEKGHSDYIVFCMENGSPGFIQNFVIDVIRYNKTGDKFYFGELLDYHY